MVGEAILLTFDDEDVEKFSRKICIPIGNKGNSIPILPFPKYERANDGGDVVMGSTGNINNDDDKSKDVVIVG